MGSLCSPCYTQHGHPIPLSVGLFELHSCVLSHDLSGLIQLGGTLRRYARNTF